MQRKLSCLGGIPVCGERHVSRLSTRVMAAPLAVVITLTYRMQPVPVLTREGGVSIAADHRRQAACSSMFVSSGMFRCSAEIDGDRAAVTAASYRRRSPQSLMNIVEDDEAGESGEALLAAFERRVQEDGGSTSVREVQRKRLQQDARKAVDDAGAVLNKALDLDGQAAQATSGGRRVAIGTGGVLETNGWRATIAFGMLTILLAFYAAATTDFGDGGSDAGVCIGDVKLCTRAEIENSRIAELVAKNRS